MVSVLLTWNPGLWNWKNLEEHIAECKETGITIRRWSCRLQKGVEIGSPVFLLCQGIKYQRGIFASGTIKTPGYKDIYWKDNTKLVNYVDVEFNIILNPLKEKIFPRLNLDKGILSGMNWDIAFSGAKLPEIIAEELAKQWLFFIKTYK